MSIMRRACEALDRQGTPRADTGTHGYHVVHGPGISAVVRWGHGRPFRSIRGTRNDDGLTSCSATLARARFRTALEQFADPGGLRIVVTERD
jgi:hypothetical protein